MSLSWPVVAAVLFGALLHAGWNALVKSSQDKALDTALIHLLGSVVAIPLVLVLGWPPAEAWPWLIASLVIHIAYYTALTGAYQHGDLGLTDPLMRGSAPLLVAVSATFTLGETLTPMAWVGVMMPAYAGLPLLGFVLIGCYVMDRRTWPAAGLAPWLPMRLHLTIVASLSCFLAAGAT